ncbi:hypothetical protein C1H46_021390 [Malus baccata]|uniref:Uncharacterized protein n=1 Tax=Malus baccata TaxID=106549 RepID=A0A540M2D8_MALBA|nr:hypothetical protein C1H46_021390 [Malus baccata]
MSQPRLENAPPTLKEKKKRCRTCECAVCLRKACNDILYPYWNRVPAGVTSVGEGSEIACVRRRRDDSMCGHNMAYARALFFGDCFNYGHDIFYCPIQDVGAKSNHDSI